MPNFRPKGKRGITLSLMMAMGGLAALCLSVPPAISQRLPLNDEVRPTWKNAKGRWVLPRERSDYADALRAEEVRQIVFMGPSFGMLSFSELEPPITDPTLISGFIHALQHPAFWVFDGQDALFYFGQMDLLRIEFWDRERPPFLEKFRTGLFENSHGPLFMEMLDKLADYRANELRHYLAEHKADLQEIVVSAGKNYRFSATRPADLQKLLTELKQVEGKTCFAYTYTRGTPAQVVVETKSRPLRVFLLSLACLTTREGLADYATLNPALPRSLREAQRAGFEEILTVQKKNLPVSPP